MDKGSEIEIQIEKKGVVEKRNAEVQIEGLREDLVGFYRSECNRLSLLPFREVMDDVAFLKVYEPPFPLESKSIGKRNDGNPEESQTTEVNSLKSVFTDGNYNYKNIYITSEAGVGKTSFANWLVLNWCQAHDPVQRDNEYFKDEDLQHVKAFDFVFLLPLRKMEIKCVDIEAMLQKWLIANLSTQTIFTAEFMDDLLGRQKCLFILDGLDEWAMQNTSSALVPLRKSWQTCSYITTSRPVVSLDALQIDRHIQIQTNNLVLGNVVLNALNGIKENIKTGQLLKELNVETAFLVFKNLITKEQTGHISSSPYFMMQVLMLWVLKSEIRTSRCDLYTDIIELLLSRASKASLLPSHLKNLPSGKVNCFTERSPYCALYSRFLFSLGKVAFDTLFNILNHSFMFTEKEATVTSSVDAGILDTGLKTGILVKNTIRSVVKEVFHFSFYHRSIQEYFAALYIQSKPDDQEVLDTIKRKCSTNSAVLEMADLFHLLDELNPKVIGELSQVLPSTIDVSLLCKSHLPREILNMDRDSVDLYKKALQDGKVSIHNIRVMVVGHFDVGKTALTKRLLGEPVDITKRASTNGIDVHIDRCKISLKDGSWIVPKSDKTRKAIFHQLAKLFDKDGQQADTQPEMNTMSVSSLDLDKANEQTTSAEQPVAELEDRAEVEIYSRIETASVSGVSDLQSASKTNESVDEKYAQNLRHLKKFVENVQVDKEHLGTSDLSLWDFAGQNVFYATHQVFFSRRAVYLLVTNISKHIDDTVDDDPWHTDCRGEAKCQIAKYIDFWLNSIHEFCSYPGESGPPVVLVGTFADQVKKDISPDDACSSLRGFLVDKAASCHLTTENFLIDNSIEDENIQSLKKHIFDEASKQTYWGEDIPAKWVTLEDILIGIKEENLKVLHKDRLKELNMTLPAPIETDEELELYLKFHHEMGNIIYFSKEDLTDYILLDPQWLIDAFKSVITAKSFCISRTNIQKEWMEFERTAMLKPGLIDAVWGKCENSVYNKYRDLLLTYMEILRLVARPVKQEDYSAKVEDWYFVPCMLKEPPPEKVTSCCDSPHCKSTSKLCYTTAEEPERRFLPATMFNKLLAACLQKWPLSKQNRKSMIFCGGAIFSLEENHFLYIFFYEHVIQVWITRLSLDGQFPDISLCTETKNNIEYILKTNIRMHSKFIAFVKCPRAVLYSNENMVQLEPTEDFPTDEIVCYCQENEHVVRYSDLTKYWSFVQDSNHSSEFESEQTSLTEKDFSKIASRIGEEYLQLGRKLGLTEAKLDHIRLDKWTTQDRIVAMLCEWKKQMADKATACYLRQALAAIGKDASAVLR